MAPSKDALPPSETTEQDYFAIARRQADALNSLEDRLKGHEENLRSLTAAVTQFAFRLEAIEDRPAVIDYADEPPRKINRVQYDYCDECGGPLPNHHFDNCSQFPQVAA